MVLIYQGNVFGDAL